MEIDCVYINGGCAAKAVNHLSAIAFIETASTKWDWEVQIF